MSDAPSVIRKVAWLLVRDGALLVARSHGKTAYYLPGGKIDPGETPVDALVREIREELAVALDRSSIRELTTVTSPAHGKPDGTLVSITCYDATGDGEPAPSSEIAELRWIRHDDEVECSAGTKRVLAFVRKRASAISER